MRGNFQNTEWAENGNAKEAQTAVALAVGGPKSKGKTQ